MTGDTAPSLFMCRLRRLMLKILLLFLILYAAGLAVAYFAQDGMIFPVRFAGPSLPEPPAGVDLLSVETEKGERVEAWFIPGAGRSDDSPGPAVIFFHGNAELIDGNAARMRPYMDAGISVLLVEYRGYGRSAGRPSQTGIVADSVRFRELLIARPEVDTSKLIYHGRSLGGGIAVQLAARHEPAALVLESTFTSIPAMVKRFPLAGLVVRHPFRSDRVMPALACPVLLLHGEQDTLIPKSHSERLEALASDARLVLLEGGHNDFPRDEQAFWDTVIPFVQSAVSQ